MTERDTISENELIWLAARAREATRDFLGRSPTREEMNCVLSKIAAALRGRTFVASRRAPAEGEAIQ
jgi:hypothetical protein